jgi:hypothetical protein
MSATTVKINITNSFPYCIMYHDGNVAIPSDFVFNATKHTDEVGCEPVYYAVDMNQCDSTRLTGWKTFLPNQIADITKANYYPQNL